MRLTFVITNAPPLMGGLEKVCLRLAQQMQARGHQVKICGRFTRARPDTFGGQFKALEPAATRSCDGIEVTVIGPDARARLLLKPVNKLLWRRKTFPVARWLYLQAMKRSLVEVCHGSDVVHFFGNGPEMLGFAAEAAARDVGAKFVVEPALHEGQWGDKWFDALLYKQAAVVLAHSRHEASVLQRMGIAAAKVRTVEHGVDLCISGDRDCFKHKHKIDGPMVLFLGRKTVAKGVVHLLKAWPEVASRFPEATLVFAGPKAGKDEALEKLTTGADGCAGELAERNPKGETSGAREATERQEDGRWELGDRRCELADRRSEIENGEERRARILDLDDLTEEEKQDALAACDVLCVPSEGESFGMVYFEAWAYGKPVVALDLPVLRETVGAAKAGILVKDDPRAIANGINTLLGDPELRMQMGSNGRKLALGHKWEEAAEHYLRGYEQAMKTKIL